MVFCVAIQSSYTFTIGGKKNNINFVAVRVIFIFVLIPILVANAFTAELRFSLSKLPVQICICSRKQIVNCIIVDAFTEHIKNLSIQETM